MFVMEFRTNLLIFQYNLFTIFLQYNNLEYRGSLESETSESGILYLMLAETEQTIISQHSPVRKKIFVT